MTVTPIAVERVKALIDGRGKPTAGVRIGVRSKGCSGLSYTLEFADKQAALIGDLYRKGGANPQEMQAALAVVEKQKADLARLETEMQALTGAWKNVIGSAAFSPDGRRIYTGDLDGTVRVWDTVSGHALDVKTGELLMVIDSSASVSVQTPMAERIKAALNKNVKIEQFKEEAEVLWVAFVRRGGH